MYLDMYVVQNKYNIIKDKYVLSFLLINIKGNRGKINVHIFDV